MLDGCWIVGWSVTTVEIEAHRCAECKNVFVMRILHYARMRRRARRALRRPVARGGRTWTRDDLYDRP